MATINLGNPTNVSATRPAFPTGAAAITPNDNDVFSVPVSIYVGVSGNVVVRPANGAAAVTFSNALAGTVLPITAIGVNATGTTATNLVAIY